MGAWIEILSLLTALVARDRSHSYWVRGLKCALFTFTSLKISVALFMGAWIEIFVVTNFPLRPPSHSLWVRGLKLLISDFFPISREVALYMSAWIEIMS